MKKVYNLLQGLLCFILAGNIFKAFARLSFHIYFGISLSKLHSGPHPFLHLP